MRVMGDDDYRWRQPAGTVDVSWSILESAQRVNEALDRAIATDFRWATYTLRGQQVPFEMQLADRGYHLWIKHGPPRPKNDPGREIAESRRPRASHWDADFVGFLREWVDGLGSWPQWANEPCE